MDLRQYLSEHKLTASEFARTIGVAHSTVLRWADGSLIPTVENAQKIARATESRVGLEDWSPIVPTASAASAAP